MFDIRAINKKKDVHTSFIDVVMSTKPSDTACLREVVSIANGARWADGLANGVYGTVNNNNNNNDKDLLRAHIHPAGCSRRGNRKHVNTNKLQ